jgi:hypothetical protein
MVNEEVSRDAERERISYSRGDFYWITAFTIYQNSVNYNIKVEEGDLRYYPKWKASLTGLFNIVFSFYSEGEQQNIIKLFNSARKNITDKNYKEVYHILTYIQLKLGKLITQKSIQRKSILGGLGSLRKELLGK